MRAVAAATRVLDTAEYAVLETMRQANTSKFTVVQTSDDEILLEIQMNEEKGELFSTIKGSLRIMRGTRALCTES